MALGAMTVPIMQPTDDVPDTLAPANVLGVVIEAAKGIVGAGHSYNLQNDCSQAVRLFFEDETNDSGNSNEGRMTPLEISIRPGEEKSLEMSAAKVMYSAAFASGSNPAQFRIFRTRVSIDAGGTVTLQERHLSESTRCPSISARSFVDALKSVCGETAMPRTPCHNGPGCEMQPPQGLPIPPQDHRFPPTLPPQAYDEGVPDGFLPLSARVRCFSTSAQAWRPAKLTSIAIASNQHKPSCVVLVYADQAGGTKLLKAEDFEIIGPDETFADSIPRSGAMPTMTAASMQGGSIRDDRFPLPGGFMRVEGDVSCFSASMKVWMPAKITGLAVASPEHANGCIMVTTPGGWKILRPTELREHLRLLQQ